MKIIERVEDVEWFRGRPFPPAQRNYEQVCSRHAMAICADWRRQEERIRELEALASDASEILHDLTGDEYVSEVCSRLRKALEAPDA